MREQIQIAEEVRAAGESGRPVVALESTIISHGMPYPQNVETALRVEEIVRQNGAVPATVGIVDGLPIAGLSAKQIERLGKGGPAITKVSRRDIPFVVATGADGATTVAATMIFAYRAGIRVFATGGIGGVHRGAQETFDISADLEELARTDIAVVCAGAKSILDLGLTLEYLETRGVPVIGFGTEEFPAFFTRTSGLPLRYRSDTPEEVARILKAKWGLDLRGGVVVANPVPEEHSMEPAIIGGIIDRALEDAELRGLRGKEITPFLLERIVELTGGSSLATNIQLAFNNAALGAQIASAYSRL